MSNRDMRFFGDDLPSQRASYIRKRRRIVERDRGRLTFQKMIEAFGSGVMSLQDVRRNIPGLEDK